MKQLYKKYLTQLLFSGLLVLIYQFNANAQGKIEPNDFPRIFAKVDSVISDYNKYSSLTDPLDGGHISDEYAYQFKNLFVENATIDDELCISWFDGDRNLSSYLNYVNRNVETYIQKRKDNFDGGTDDNKVLNTDISYNSLSAGEVIVIMEKKTSATISKSGITISTIPLIQLDLIFSDNYKTLKIGSIRIISTNDSKQIAGYKHSENDKDMDFLSGYDEDERYPGISGTDGRPSSSEIAYLKSIGYNFDSKFNLEITPNYGIVIPDIPNFDSFSVLNNNYASATDWLDSNRAITPEITKISSIGANLMATYFFGIRSKFGVSTGLKFDYFTGTIATPEFSVMFKDTTKAYDYRRIINSVGEISEDFTATSFSIPLLAKVKFKFNNKLSMEIGAGGIFNFLFNSKTKNLNGNFIYEAVRTRQSGGNNITGVPNQTDTINYKYFNQNDIDAASSTNNQIYVENATINYNGGNFNNKDFKDVLDLSLSKNPNDINRETKFTGGFGVLVNAQLYYKLSDKFLLF